MTIPAKYQYIAAGVLILVAFAGGRYSNRGVSVTSDSTTKTDLIVNQDKNTHTVTTTIQEKQPTGAVKTVTTVDTVTDTKTTAQKDTDKTKVETITPAKTSLINVSALVANDFSRGLLVPTYGVSVNKELIGPITLGAFGLTSGIVGVSIGLNF